MNVRTLACARGLLSALALMVATTARADVAVPPLAAHVTDLTATLSSQQRSALEEKLAAFEKRKGSQVAVLIVSSTQPEDIEQYSIRVVDAWKLGRKGTDDGALLLVAKDDRKMRIEVGRGLEGAVPDLYAKRIVADTITPYFKLGDFYGGIDAGVTQLLALIDGEPLPEPDRSWTGNARALDNMLPLLLIGSLVVGGILRSLLGRMPGALTTGGVVGVIVWLVAGLLAVGVIAGFLAFLLVLIGGTNGGRWASGRRGGWAGGGFGGGGGGFGGGGGGFSGGGGGFSGGGASGGW